MNLHMTTLKKVEWTASGVRGSVLGVGAEAAAPRAEAANSPALAAGAAVRIGGQRFRVGVPLGEGSFGAVWAAEGEDGNEVAVKEILCRSEAELARAELEGQLLRLLAGDTSGEGCDVDRRARAHSGRAAPLAVARCLPTLAASEVAASGPSSWCVRLAMSRVPGAPLEQFLEHRRRGAAGSEPGHHFAEACRYAGELLVQLAPALEHISSRVYHRDVTPRNILIDESGEGGPRFGLVDFGLAVDATQWRSDECSGDLGGDGRYWPASAWLVFGHGKQELAAHPPLRHEYRSCLDVHALGLTALRCLMELAPALPEQGSAPEGKEAPCLGAALPKLRAVRTAWQRYWSDARRFWQPVYDAFREGGDFEALKAAYARAGVHRIISADLCSLRAALLEARYACESAPRGSGLAGMPAFFDALLLMVRPGLVQAPNSPLKGSVLTPAEPTGGEEQQCDEGTVPEVLRCISQSTAAPDSAASSPSSSSRVSPAESLVLMTPVPAPQVARAASRPAVAAVAAAAAAAAAATRVPAAAA